MSEKRGGLIEGLAKFLVRRPLFSTILAGAITLFLASGMSSEQAIFNTQQGFNDIEGHVKNKVMPQAQENYGQPARNPTTTVTINGGVSQGSFSKDVMSGDGCDQAGDTTTSSAGYSFTCAANPDGGWLDPDKIWRPTSEVEAEAAAQRNTESLTSPQP